MALGRCDWGLLAFASLGWGVFKAWCSCGGVLFFSRERILVRLAMMTAHDHDAKVGHAESPLRDEENDGGVGDVRSLGDKDILQQEHTDPILNAKMHLVNDAIGTG